MFCVGGEGCYRGGVVLMDVICCRFCVGMIYLSWASVRRVRRGSSSSELLMCGGGVCCILLLPLVAICLVIIDV